MPRYLGTNDDRARLALFDAEPVSVEPIDGLGLLIVAVEVECLGIAGDGLAWWEAAPAGSGQDVIAAIELEGDGGAIAGVEIAVPGLPGLGGNGAAVATDLGITNRTASGLRLTSSTGDDVDIPAATSQLAGLATAAQVQLIEGAVQEDDSRLDDSREWSAATVTRAAAEGGEETIRRAWTVERVWQALAAWWTATSTAAGRALVTAANAAAQRTALGLGSAAQVDVPSIGNASAGQAVLGSDSRMGDAREWSAQTVDQAEAEAGTATVRRAWTAVRVWQAIGSWWTGTSSAAGRAMVGAADAAAQRALLGLGTAALEAATALRDRGSHTGSQPISSITGLSSSLAAKADLVGGVVPTSQIPSIALVEFKGYVANQAAMLALRGEAGDWAIRQDRGTKWAIVSGDGSLLAHWVEVPTGFDVVGSVNGQTGTVVLGTGDLAESGGNLFFTTARARGAVPGSSGQVSYNNAGTAAGDANFTWDPSTGLAIGRRFTNSTASSASTPAKIASGAWFTGGTSTTTKPHFLIEPSGATSTGWSTSGTGLGINAASGFTGNLFDLQLNGTTRFSVNSVGGATFAAPGATQYEVDKRTALTTFPVPFFRPTQANTVLALDVMPNGTPSENVGNGFAWFDVCDADCKSGDPPVRTARVGIRAGLVEFGSRNFNGASAIPVIMTVSGTEYQRWSPTTGVTFTVGGAERLGITSGGLVTLGGTTSAFPAFKRSGVNVQLRTADDGSFGTGMWAGTFRLSQGYTVSGLSALSPQAGHIALITDASSPTIGSVAAGGGSTVAAVFYNGSAWKILCF